MASAGPVTPMAAAAAASASDQKIWTAAKTGAPAKVAQARTEIGELRAAAPRPSGASVIQQSGTAQDDKDLGYRSIKHAACADSYHDFGHGGKSFNTTREVKDGPGLGHVVAALDNSKWPTQPLARNPKSLNSDMLRDENTMLQELFAGAAANVDFAKTSDLVSTLEANNGEIFIDIQRTIYGPQQYEVKMLNHDYKYDVGTSASRAPITNEDINNFFGKNEINLLFDASVINITRLFLEAVSPGPGITVNRIVNREIVNDPAPKTYEKSAKDRAAEEAGGNKYNILFENSKDTITYVHNPSHLINNDLQRDKFFSKFDLTLSPFKSADRKSLPRIGMTIRNPTAGDTSIYTSDDPHENNNIQKCWNRIKKLFASADKKMGGQVVPGTHEEVGVHFQCKRSGDWLQALSCLDIGRQYVDSNNTNYKLQNENIILVTHDRVLLWYALFMGIDVILTWKKPAGAEEETTDDNTDEDDTSEKRLIYFNNARRAASPEERYLKMIDIADTMLQSSDDLISYIADYNGWLVTIKRAREAEIQRLENVDPDAGTPTKAVFLTNYSTCVKNILQAYWRYYSMNYTNVSADNINETKALYLAFKKQYKEDVASDEALKTCAEKATAFISACRGIQILKSRFPDSTAVINANNDQCKTDDLYINVPIITSEDRASQGRARKPSLGAASTGDADTRLSEQQRAAALATHFVDTATPEHLQKLHTFIKKIHDGPRAIEAGSQKSYIPMFLVALSPGLQPPAVAAEIPADVQTHINEILKDEAEEHKNMLEEAEAEAKDEGAAAAAAAARAAAAAEEEAAAAAAEQEEEGEGEEEAAARAAAAAATAAERDAITAAEKTRLETAWREATAASAKKPKDAALKAAAAAAKKAYDNVYGPGRGIVQGDLQNLCGADGVAICEGVPPNNGSINRIRVFVNSATTRLNLGKYFRSVLPFFTRAGPAAAVGGGHVGGDPDVVKHTAYYTMFNFYMMELTSQLESFETADNGDYIYYDALARLVLAATADKDNAPDNLRYSRYVSYLYEQIPQLTQETGLAFYSNGDFMSNVAFVGRNVALQSLAMATSELPSLAYDATTTVPLVIAQKTADGQTYMSPYTEEYVRLKAEMKGGKTFAERQRALCLELLNRVEMSASPDSPEFGQTAVAASVIVPAVSSYNALVNEISQKGVQKISDRDVKAYLEKIKEMISSGEIDPGAITPEGRALYAQLEQREKARVAKLMIAVGSKNVNPYGTAGITSASEGIAARGGGRRTRKRRGGARHVTRKQRGYKRGSTRGSRKQRN